MVFPAGFFPLFDIRRADIRRVNLGSCRVTDKTNKLTLLYPDRRRHVVGADFCKVSAHDAVVKPIEEHDDTDVHGVLRLDPEQGSKQEGEKQLVVVVFLLHFYFQI